MLTKRKRWLLTSEEPRLQKNSAATQDSKSPSTLICTLERTSCAPLATLDQENLATCSLTVSSLHFLYPYILTTFYRRTIESILTSCLTAWSGNCTVSDQIYPPVTPPTTIICKATIIILTHHTLLMDFLLFPPVVLQMVLVQQWHL